MRASFTEEDPVTGTARRFNLDDNFDAAVRTFIEGLQANRSHEIVEPSIPHR